MPLRKGMNNYKIDGDTTIIYITTQEKKTYEVLIDTEDLPKLLELNSAWTIRNTKHELLYVRTSFYHGEPGKRKSKTIYLHRLITGADFSKGEYVDHENHNTLDNRKRNLRVTAQIKNTKNRKSKNKNNTSGYRNVSYDKDSDKWIVQISINGKNTLLGKFDDVDEAGAFAKEMRKKYYKEYKGAS